MKDALGHELTNFQQVRYDSDIEEVGKEALVKVMQEVKWKTNKVFWCPTCKEWSCHE